MKQELIDRLVQQLAPQGFVSPDEAEKMYPPRVEMDGKPVLRSAPSPTGFLHIGTVYMGLINERLSHKDGGIFYLRIEDTDKAREVANGTEQIISGLEKFGIIFDEGPTQGGNYGPYSQSERAKIYLGYAIELLKKGRAYPCFATSDELDSIRKRQEMEKVRPGYRGDYALWRNRSESDIENALNSGHPFVLRFKSQGNHEQRIDFVDKIKGPVSLPQNDLDVPLIKSDGLPTYHLAHVVDDYLMRTSLVLRGDEWLPSAPLHVELCESLELPVFNYAHFAPISVLDNGNKRKLSKRKDVTANVQYWFDEGYPPEAVIEYLMRLANSNYEDWRVENPLASFKDFDFTMEKLAMSRAPLLDMKKMQDVSRDYIGQLDQAQFNKKLIDWLEEYDAHLTNLFAQDPLYTNKILTIEREGTNRRKDIYAWSQARDMYGYFFDELYNELLPVALQSELAEIPEVDQKNALANFLANYNHSADQSAWLENLRSSATSAGYAVDSKDFKQNPSQYKGNLADFAKIIRVWLTGKNRTPDLYLIMQIMGDERVKRRLSA